MLTFGQNGMKNIKGFKDFRSGSNHGIVSETTIHLSLFVRTALSTNPCLYRLDMSKSFGIPSQLLTYHTPGRLTMYQLLLCLVGEQVGKKKTFGSHFRMSSQILKRHIFFQESTEWDPTYKGSRGGKEVSRITCLLHWSNIFGDCSSVLLFIKNSFDSLKPFTIKLRVVIKYVCSTYRT